MKNTRHSASPAKAWIITGPTSGIGHRTALEVAQHGTVVLVGRDPGRLGAVEAEIQKQDGGHAVSVVCDFSDITSVRRAAAQIIGLELPIAGLVNNVGIFPLTPAQTALGWDLTFATDHLGRSRSPRRSSPTSPTARTSSSSAPVPRIPGAN
jgi:NAD(P)-dependent dehydrogenase (short-subunit alcohol dehydrogenase family)